MTAGAEVAFISRTQHELAKIAAEFAAKWDFDVRPGIQMMASAEALDGSDEEETTELGKSVSEVLDAARTMHQEGRDAEAVSLLASFALSKEFAPGTTDLAASTVPTQPAQSNADADADAVRDVGSPGTPSGGRRSRYGDDGF